MNLSSNSSAGVLFKVLGRRPFMIFGLVSGIVVFLLAAVTVTSRYAMQRYVADQVERVPWDLSIYQTAEVSLSDKLNHAAANVSGVARTERLAFLRTILPYTTKPMIDGQQVRSPWTSIMSATDPSLLPQDIRPSGSGAVLVLVGSKSQMGDAYLRLQNRKRFELVVERKQEKDDEHEHAAAYVHTHEDGTAHVHKNELITVALPIERVIRVDSTEINRWFMEQTSSPTLIPELGMIFVAPWNTKLLEDFDSISRGIIHVHNEADIHGDPGHYYPEVIHLARVDRPALVSGWDIDGSLTRIIKVGSYLTDEVQDLMSSAAVDHNLGTMFVRMNEIARRIGLISLLVSLPLILIAAILLGTLSNLLLLNERRTLGLLRLRGVPGRAIGRTLLVAIGLGGLVGGCIGAVLGTLIPLAVYMHGLPPLELLPKIQQPLYLAGFLSIGLAVSLATGRRLVRDASQVSPLEASRRVAQFEGESVRVRFGAVQLLALIIGAAKLVSWMGDWQLARWLPTSWAGDLDRALDFICFPLLIYGLVSLIVSRQRLMSALMRPTIWLMTGPLRAMALHHMELRRHRAASFLLIVALLATLALYPTVMTAVFDNKTERGAKVQLGGDLQVTLNALDLMPAEVQARGGFRERLAALRERLDPLVAKLRATPGVRQVSTLVEGLSDGVYMPDRGFSGLPIYFVSDAQEYLGSIYAEPALGESGPFAAVVSTLDQNDVLGSSSIAKFYKRAIGQSMPVGRTTAKTMERAPFGGSLRFLPGAPLRTVNDREGFVSARVDYLNHLFSNSPFLVGAGGNPALSQLDVLIPRVVLIIAATDNRDAEALRRAVLANVGVTPLDVRDLETEVARLGSDMYIFLARQNVQIYLFGGVLLALIGIFSVAYANYMEDRRTLALLRIRGAGPVDVVRFFLPNVVGPSLIGLLLGALISLAVGFGITRLIWDLRQLQTVMNYIPTRLAISGQTLLVALVLLLLLVGIVGVFGRWVFARTARQALREG